MQAESKQRASREQTKQAANREQAWSKQAASREQTGSKQAASREQAGAMTGHHLQYFTACLCVLHTLRRPREGHWFIEEGAMG